MKRHNLIIIALLALTLCVTGAMAQNPGNETPDPGNVTPDPGVKPDPGKVVNPDPGNVTPQNLPGDVAPKSAEVAPLLEDERPYYLGLLPSQPQLQPAPPPRGVTPVPPPNPGGIQWGEGKKPIRWFMFPIPRDDNN